MNTPNPFFLQLLLSIFGNYGIANDQNLSVCVSNLIKTSFREEATLIMIFDNFPTLYRPDVTNPSVIIDINRPIELSSEYYTDYIIHTDDAVSLNRTTEKLKKSKVWNESASPKGNFLIITRSFINTDMIFKTLWEHDVLNVIAIIYEEFALKVLWCDFFGVENNCGKQVKLVHEYDCAEHLKVSFERGLRAFKNCRFSDSEKGEIVKPVTSKQSPGGAIIVSSILEIGNLFNIHLHGFVDKNSTINQKSDSTIVEPFSVRRSEQLVAAFDLSDAIYTDRMMWVVPKPSQITGIRVFTFIYDNYVWSLMGATVALILAIWWLAARCLPDHNTFQSLSRCMLAVLAISMGSAEYLQPATVVLKYLALLYMVYSMEIITAFQANLISMLTEPMFGPPISTIEELADSSVGIVYTTAMEGFGLNIAYNPEVYDKIRAKFVFKDGFNQSQNVVDIVQFRNTSALLAAKAVKVIVTDESQVDLLESRLLPLEVTVYLRKGHYIIPHVNRALKIINENGFGQKIHNEISFKYKIYNEKPKVALGMKHVFGIFVCLIIGLTLAICVFVLEQLVEHLKNPIN